MSTVKHFRALCKEKNLRGYSGKRKSDLIEMLNNPEKYITVSRGKHCLRNGKSYEEKVRLALIKSNNKIQCFKTAGASHSPDIVFELDQKNFTIEVKNKNATECGQRSLKLIEGKLSLPDISNNQTHIQYLGNHIPFGGKIPSFLKGNKSLNVWLTEKPLFKDEYLELDRSACRKYYKANGSDYIQIEGKGLYHTGSNPLGLDTPLFECRSRMRIRCKQHGSTSLPSSVQAVFLMDKKTLEKSPTSIC